MIVLIYDQDHALKLNGQIELETDTSNRNTYIDLFE